MIEALVGIGRLERIEVEAADGSLLMVTGGANIWLAWRGAPTVGTIVGVELNGVQIEVDALPAKVRAAHRTFHSAEPRGGVTGIAAGRPHRLLGVALAVRYDVPESMPSNKAGVRWHHKLGDFGRDRGGDKSDQARYRPEVWLDANHLPVLVRKPGNRYRLSDWLVG